MVIRRDLLLGLSAGTLADANFSAAAPPSPGAVPALMGAEIVPDVESLRSARPIGEAVILLRHTRPGDGGGGLLLRDHRPQRVADEVTVLSDGAGSLWSRVGGGPIDVRWAGAFCDGVTDDTVAVLRAASLGAILFPTGVTLVSGSLRLTAHVEIAAGARLLVPRNSSIVFGGGFRAARTQVFEGGGGVTLDPATTPTGYPEWWGAHTNTPGFDCGSAVQAALDACAIVELGGADYHVSSALVMRRPNSILRGVASNQDGHAGASRLIVDSPVEDGLRVGFDAAPDGPGTTSRFIEHVTVEHLAIVRSVAPEARPADDEMKGFRRSPAGLRLQYAVTCYITDVVCIQHSNGFYIEGAVHCYVTDCQAIRNTNGPSSNDFFNGFFQNNSVNIGYNSGNASVYYRNCSVFASADGIAAAGSGSSGLYTYGGFTDTQVAGLETAHLGVGINANGAGAADPGYSSENLRIEGCLLDSCTTAGILVNEGNDGTAITISGTYVAAAGKGACVSVTSTSGAVAITGCQFISGPGSNGVGIFGFRSSGISSVNNLFTDVSSPIVLKFCNNCGSTDDTFNNVRVGCAPTGSFWLISSSRCHFRSRMKGRPGINPAAVNLTINTEGAGAGVVCDRNEIHLSGIDPECLVRGAENKLQFEGVVVHAAGSFGSGASAHNLASGMLD